MSIRMLRYQFGLGKVIAQGGANIDCNMVMLFALVNVVKPSD